MSRKPAGHPAKQDEATARLFRTMRAAVELVRDLDGKLSDGTMLQLKAGTLGLMEAYAELVNLPSPTELLEGKK